MKWELIKKNVARNVCSSIYEPATFEVMANILIDSMASEMPVSRNKLKDYADKVYDVIMSWDIRGAERLRELFPNDFPKKLSKGELVGYMGEDGFWHIFPKTT